MTFKSRILASLSLFVFAFPAAVQANFFLSLGRPTVEIGGDMDGETFVAGGGSSEIMPDHDDGSGFKLGLGYYSDAGSIDVAWVETEHDGEWVGLPTESTFRSLNIDVKWSILGKQKLRGLIIGGIGFSCVIVEDGSVGLGEVEDAVFNGLDFRFGFGVRYRLLKNLAIEANMIQRYGSYDDVEGVVSGSLSDDLDGDGVTTMVELIYVFTDD